MKLRTKEIGKLQGKKTPPRRNPLKPPRRCFHRTKEKTKEKKTLIDRWVAVENVGGKNTTST
jgi:hypothetical protein